jgi:hypothetical protein
MHVPGRRQEEREVDREPDDRGEQQRHAEQHAEPDRDLDEGDADTGRDREAREHVQQRSRRRAGREPPQLCADEIRAAGAQEVAVEQLLGAGEHERPAEERPHDA